MGIADMHVNCVYSQAAKPGEVSNNLEGCITYFSSFCGQLKGTRDTVCAI